MVDAPEDKFAQLEAAARTFREAERVFNVALRDAGRAGLDVEIMVTDAVHGPFLQSRLHRSF